MKRIKNKVYLMGRIIALCLLLMTVMLPEQVQASGTEKRTVRVGYPVQKGLTEISENGVYSGYTYEYLMEIQRYANWDYEFVTLEGNEDEQLTGMLEMLQNGELDLMGGMVYSEGLSKMYDYSFYNYGTGYSILAISDDNEEVDINNFYKKTPLRVAVFSTKGTPNESLEEYADMNGMQVEQVYCDSWQMQMEQLQNGGADVLLAKDVSIESDGLITVAKFLPSPFYFVTTKGNTELLNELNGALVNISKADPYFMTDLYNKYFNVDSKKLVFSERERKYMQNLGRLKAVAYAGKPPIQYMHNYEEGGRGVSVDVLEYIKQATGLDIELTMTESYEEYVRLARAADTDLVIGVSDGQSFGGSEEMILTRPYLNLPVAMVYRGGGMSLQEPETMALPEGFDYKGVFGGEIYYMDTPEACLEAVNDGKADICYLNIYTAQYYMNNHKYNKLELLQQPADWSEGLCIGIADKDGNLLFRILNKTLRHLEESGEVQKYLLDNAYRSTENISLGDYIATNPVQFVVSVSIGVVCVGILVLLLLRHQDRKNSRIRELANRRYEQLNELSNEYLFEYEIAGDTLRLSDKSAAFLGCERRLGEIQQKDGSIYAELVKRSEAEPYVRERDIEAAGGRKKRVRVMTITVYDEKKQPAYIIGKFTDIQDEYEERENLRKKAERDELTGVYSVRTFREKAIERLQGQGPFAFVILDVDRFKEVNDTYGHYIGDYVLKELAGILSETAEEDGIAGRLGGDEFMVLLSFNIQQVKQFCHGIEERVKQVDFEGKIREITVSIGVCMVRPGMEYDEIYKEADEVLYEVKRKGRNGFGISTGSE